MENKKIFVTRASMPKYEEYIEAIKPLWDTHMLTNMGENHRDLEKKLVEYLDVKNMSLFTNGHMALELTLQAMNLTGEVITTPFTFVSTTHAIVRNNLKPVFCDINEEDYTIDANKIEALITDKTTAIVPVHVYGNVCDVEAIEKIAKKYDLKVIYDAAHAFGVTYDGIGVGNFGDASVYSFHATKSFNTIEGGGVATSNEQLIKDLYTLKNFGFKSDVIVDGIGANAKMNEFQAIMGILNLKYFEENVSKRRKIVEYYRERLRAIPGIRVLEENPRLYSNYTYFPVVVDEKKYGKTRNEIIEILNMHDIYPRRYFYPITNALDCYKENYDSTLTPIALHISKRIMTLPLYADLDMETVELICNLIEEGYKK